MNDITLIIPYYNQPKMLGFQLQNIHSFLPDTLIHFVVIDDCSKEHPAEDVFNKYGKHYGNLYRIDTDIPWNRNGARNLGAHLAGTDWIIQTDIDHLLLPGCANRLLQIELDHTKWYRFNRYRAGKADETRRKDAIPDHIEYGKIKPHIDSYLMTREQYLSSPYDERYRGFLGGGSPFLARQKRIYGDAELLPEDIYLQVFTRNACPDSSTQDLSRDTSEYQALRKKIEATGDDTPIKPINFKWHRVF